MIDRDEMIRILKGRIEWLENNPDDKEYNVRELVAAKNYLSKLEPPELNLEEGYYAAEESLKRFWGSLEARAEFDDERQRFLTGDSWNVQSEEQEDAPEGKSRKAETSADEKKTGGIFLYFAYHKGMAACVAVAVLVLAMLIGGTAGAFVQSRVEMFHVLKNDEEGMEAIISPEINDEVVGKYDVEMNYNNWEDIPEEYSKILVLPSVLYDKYNLSHISVQENARHILFKARYKIDDNVYIECSQTSFKEDPSYYSQSNDNYGLFMEESINSVDVEYYEYDDENGKGYAANFRNGRDVFFVKSGMNIDEFQKIVRCIIGEFS